MDYPTIMRNAKIAAMHEMGMSYRDIAEMYGISYERAAQICRKFAEIERLHEDELFVALKTACTSLGLTDWHARRLYSTMRRSFGYCTTIRGGKGGVYDMRTLDGVIAAEKDGFDFYQLRGIGARSVEIIKTMVYEVS